MQIYNVVDRYMQYLSDSSSYYIFVQNDITSKLTVAEIDPGVIWSNIYLMLNNFIQATPIIALGLITFSLFYIIGKFIRKVVKKLVQNRRGYNIGLVLGRLAQWVCILLGILIALAIIFPSITPSDLLAGLGIGGIALGFAFKDILQNYLAGILILLQEPFKIGDEIRYQEFEGNVEFIDTRTTFIKSYDGRRVLIPNSEVYTNAIIVNTAYNYRCSEYDLAIGCNEDLNKASNVVLNSLKSIDGVMENPAPNVFVTALDDFKNILKVRWWTTPRQIDVLRIKSEVLSAIKRDLDSAGVELPFPTQVVLWHDETEKMIE